jgi:short-subunit dehydrogenase
MPPDRKSLLVVGGTSDIAKATALTFAEKGWSVTISGRELPVAQAEAANLGLRMPGSAITAVALDILDTASFTPFLDNLPVLPDAVLLAVGLLGDQALAEQRIDHATLVMRSNFEGPCLLMGLIASRFEERGSGTIIGISSVAGDRGRASNYVYGAAKAGLSAFLSGLRNRLAAKGVHVLTVKPGFVRTRMTAGMTLPAALTAEPQELAVSIYSAVEKHRNIIYVRPVWRLIMTIIKSIPEGLFKKLRL